MTVYTVTHVTVLSYTQLSAVMTVTVIILQQQTQTETDTSTL